MGLGSMYHTFDKVNALQMTGNKGEWREFMQRLCTNTFRLYPHKYVGRETKKKRKREKGGRCCCGVSGVGWVREVRQVIREAESIALSRAVVGECVRMDCRVGG